MNATRIVFFAFMLFIFQVASGAITTLLVGTDEIGVLTITQLIAGVLISVCVFGYMSWANPSRPYLTALVVGVLAMVFGVLATTFVVGNMSWSEPILLIVDILALLVSVVLGVSLGLMLRRRSSTTS